MAAKLDIKSMAVAHGEKVVLGIVLLLVVWFLMGARWSTYQRQPSEFSDKIAQGRNNLDQNDWGEANWNDEQKKLHAIEESEQPDVIVRGALDSPLNVSDYELTIEHLTFDPWTLDQPLQKVVAVTPNDAISSSGYVFLEFTAEEEEAEAEEGEEDADAEETPSDEPIPDEFLSPSQGVAGGQAGPGGTAGTAATPYGGDLYSEFEAMSAQGMMASSAQADEARAQMMGGGRFGPGGGVIGAEGGAQQVEMNRNGQLYPYVSVRAIFNVQEQINRIVAATQYDEVTAASAFRFMDFELQRSSKKSDGTWNDWETVQIQVAKDILDDVLFHNADVVSNQVTDPVITMPLPGRISGKWQSDVTHPLLDSFNLTDEQIQQQVELNRRLFDAYLEEHNSLMDSVQEGRGFADMTVDTRQVQSQLMGPGAGGGGGGYGMSAQMEAAMMGGGSGGTAGRGPGMPNPDEFIEKLMEAEDDEAIEALLREAITERITSDGQLMLFRYIDFNVRPGETYRYRVRIEIDNPNFGRRPSDAGGDREVVETPSIWTDWSNITPEAYVEPMAQYFLAKIDPARGSRDLPMPYLSFYQRSSTLGSIVHHGGVPVSFGSQVGGTQETEQYDVAHNVYIAADETEDDKSSFTFASDEYLVCALPDIAIVRDEHADISHPTGSSGMLRLTEAVVVVDDAGELRVLDTVSGESDSAAAERLYSLQADAEPFKSMRERTTAAPAGDDPYSGDYGYGSEAMMGGYMQQSDNRRLRSRGGSRGGRGQGAGGPPGMGGYGAPGMGGR